MLELLQKLGKLADQLDSKSQYKLADEVEAIMQTIKKAQELPQMRYIPKEKVPPTDPRLDPPRGGDGTRYAYSPEYDQFVITEPERYAGEIVAENTMWRSRLPHLMRVKNELGDQAFLQPYAEEAVSHQGAGGAAYEVPDRISRSKLPPKEPALSAIGDEWGYAWLPGYNAFVIVETPPGREGAKGIVIKEGHPKFHKSWQILQDRMEKSLQGAADTSGSWGEMEGEIRPPQPQADVPSASGGVSYEGEADDAVLASEVEKSLTKQASRKDFRQTMEIAFGHSVRTPFGR